MQSAYYHHYEKACKLGEQERDTEKEFDVSQYVQPYEEDLYRFIFSLFL